MMSFNESINTLVNTYGLKILNDKFKTLSYLLDCVGSNHYEKKLVECFMCVHYQENLVFLFKKKGILRTRKYLQNKYPSYKNNYTKKEYIDSINPISKIVCPIRYTFLKIINNR